MKRELKKIKKLNVEKTNLEKKLNDTSCIITSCKLTKRQKESFLKKYNKIVNKLNEVRSILLDMVIDYSHKN